MSKYARPVTTVEPPDGSLVLVEQEDRCGVVEWVAIFRDDARAARYAAGGVTDPDDRWFSSGEDDECLGDDGMGWTAYLKYVDAVYLIDRTSRVEVTR